jgi:hypothetical protein
VEPPANCHPALLICPVSLELLAALDEHAAAEGVDRAAAARALLGEALDVHRIARAMDRMAATAANDNVIPFPTSRTFLEDDWS